MTNADTRIPPVAGLILAGGLSRRMGGGDKTLLLLDGRPMLLHVIDRLAPQVGPLAVNAMATRSVSPLSAARWCPMRWRGSRDRLRAFWLGWNG